MARVGEQRTQSTAMRKQQQQKAARRTQAAQAAKAQAKLPAGWKVQEQQGPQNTPYKGLNTYRASETQAPPPPPALTPGVGGKRAYMTPQQIASHNALNQSFNTAVTNALNQPAAHPMGGRGSGPGGAGLAQQYNQQVSNAIAAAFGIPTAPYTSQGSRRRVDEMAPDPVYSPYQSPASQNKQTLPYNYPTPIINEPYQDTGLNQPLVDYWLGNVTPTDTNTGGGGYGGGGWGGGGGGGGGGYSANQYNQWLKALLTSWRI